MATRSFVSFSRQAFTASMFCPATRDALSRKDAAAQVTALCPPHVLLDRVRAVRDAREPRFDRAAEPPARGLQHRIAAEQLTGRIFYLDAAVLFEQGLHAAQRAIFVLVVGARGKRQSAQGCGNRQYKRAHAMLTVMNTTAKPWP
ncbi:hypothetical protein ACFFWD_08455 [Bradyrhizobium erythrophlei]|uniref:hypothetical protein n=1 Tax=Bradyrhizobium erythrophlei TaxID=1437360 RepID=UPI0035E6F758